MSCTAYASAKTGEIPAMGRAVSTHHVLQRRAGEEILLLEAQALACVGVVVGVQHTADIFGGVPLAHGSGIFLGVEQIEIECLERLGLPQTQCIDGFHSVADDRRVVRHGAHGLPAELHSDGILLPAYSMASQSAASHRRSLSGSHPQNTA